MNWGRACFKNSLESLWEKIKPFFPSECTPVFSKELVVKLRGEEIFSFEGKPDALSPEAIQIFVEKFQEKQWCSFIDFDLPKGYTKEVFADKLMAIYDGKQLIGAIALDKHCFYHKGKHLTHTEGIKHIIDMVASYSVPENKIHIITFGDQEFVAYKRK